MLNLIFTLAISQDSNIKDQRTTGNWYYLDWNKKGDQSPWRKNQMALPASFVGNQDGGFKSWNFDPIMREKVVKLLNTFVASEPKPSFNHHMISITHGVKIEPGKPMLRFEIALGDFAWKYDSKGRLIPDASLEGGFNPFSLGRILVNGASTKSGTGHGIQYIFPYVEELSVRDRNEKDKLPFGYIYNVPPTIQNYDFPLMQRQISWVLNESDAQIRPTGLEEGGMFFAKCSLAGTRPKMPLLITEYGILFTHNGKIPVKDYLTRGQLLDLLALLAEERYQKVRKEMAARPMPSDEKKRTAELNYQQRNLDPELRRKALLEKLKALWSSSQNEIAIVHPNFYKDVTFGHMANTLDEEFDEMRGSKNPRKRPLDMMFISDPKLGHRFGRRDPDFYKDLKPGEIRSIQYDTTITHRYSVDPRYKMQSPPGEYTLFADAPGNIRHALIYNFDWKAIKSLLGN